MSAKTTKVLVLAQTPPPLHGQAIMMQYFLEGQYTRVELHHIRMAFSGEIAEVGRLGMGKLLHLLKLIAQIIAARFHTGATVLYYPPAGPNLVPFLRDGILLISTRWLFRRTVFHFHAAGLSSLYDCLIWPLKGIFRLAYFHPDLAITISEDGRRDAQFLRAAKTSLIPNGVPDTFPGLPTSFTPPTILFLGMVCAEKGVGVLLDACALLLRRDVEFRCVIAGRESSAMEMNVFRQKAELLEGRITFPGTVHGSAKDELFAKADIFCFPTYYASESFGLVAVEAMMFQLPVVASNWRALPEIVKDGQTGFLTPVRDAAAVADKLEILLRDPSLSKQMGAAGRDCYLKSYSLPIFQHRMEEALASLNP